MDKLHKGRPISQLYTNTYTHMTGSKLSAGSLHALHQYLCSSSPLSQLSVAASGEEYNRLLKVEHLSSWLLMLTRSDSGWSSLTFIRVSIVMLTRPVAPQPGGNHKLLTLQGWNSRYSKNLSYLVQYWRLRYFRKSDFHSSSAYSTHVYQQLSNNSLNVSV